MAFIITPRQSLWDWCKDKISPQVKAALIGAGVVLVGWVGTGVIQFVIYRSENSRLTRDLQDSENRIHGLGSEISSLRHENQNLISTNNRWQLLLDPIQKKAKEIYPDLEVSAAVAKLGQDLQETRNLATRQQFRPLASASKSNVVSALTAFARQQKITVFTVSYIPGSRSRASLAEELGQILREAGATAETREAMMMPENKHVDVRVFVNPSVDMDNVKDFAASVHPFLNTQLTLLGNATLPTNEMQLQILGTPTFLPNGTVLFE